MYLQCFSYISRYVCHHALHANPACSAQAKLKLSSNVWTASVFGTESACQDPSSAMWHAGWLSSSPPSSPGCALMPRAACRCCGLMCLCTASPKLRAPCNIAMWLLQWPGAHQCARMLAGEAQRGARLHLHASSRLACTVF